MQPVVQARNLTRRFGTLEALRGVSFSIDRGEVVGLLGENGAGKSTTMRILTGFLAATSGTARVCGLDVLQEPHGVAERIGYLPESAPLYGEMTARGWLEHLGRIRKLGVAHVARRIEVVGEECGITQRLSQRISSLSRGYRQRVGLAGALLHEPELLVLDEPTSGLDPNQIVEIRQVIRRVGATRTVVLSTHILPEVQMTCDRVLIIHQGQLVADQPTDVLLAGADGHITSVAIASGVVDVAVDVMRKQLLDLSGVAEVRDEAPHEGESFRWALHGPDDVRAAAFHWAKEHGYVLVELSARRSTLESVFRRLTEGDA
jgi:ABC-2 type transport system ATP-binding protein